MQGDKDRLSQVVRNVLSNAVKFTPRGGRIDVTLASHGGFLRLSVRDTGVGIREDFLPHVFEHFRQDDGSHSRAYGGLGLGLAIARELVDLHGGNIWAESAGEGRGATLTIDVPSSVAGGVLDSAPAALEPPDGSLDGVRVLVLDDERDARDGIAAVLGEYGAVVSVASCVSEALREVTARTPDVVISDISMPGEDGYAFIRKLRALPVGHGGDLPAAALTAHAGAASRSRVLAAGFQEHISKSVDATKLVEVIARLKVAGSEIGSAPVASGVSSQGRA